MAFSVLNIVFFHTAGEIQAPVSHLPPPLTKKDVQQSLGAPVITRVKKFVWKSPTTAQADTKLMLITSDSDIEDATPTTSAETKAPTTSADTRPTETCGNGV